MVSARHRALGLLLCIAAYFGAAVGTQATEQSLTPDEESLESAPPEVPERLPLIDLNMLETADLRLLYFDPAETYLTPYLGRNFHNALDFHQKMFDWQPWEKTTLLLKDFSDYGNAAARASPNNAILFDIAPLSLTFETFSPGERFYTLSNHELTHVAQMDLWNEDDAYWRRLFAGKPMAEQDHPESIFYNYLTTPRTNVPRWFLEGIAVFMETWMAGGYGRAQGAYDEMVFRSMVRDDAHFYSPLGLESEGTSIDFQVGVNNYLYGTRFISYLAYQYSPEHILDWIRREPDSEAYYAAEFLRVFGKLLDVAWQDWIVWEKTFQSANLETVNRLPVSEATPLSNTALGSVSRSFINPRNGSVIAAFRYPGVIAHLGAMSPTTGEIENFTNIKGPMLYSVTSLAYDPAQNRAWFTADNYAYRDLIQFDLGTGKETMLLKDARIGGIVFNPADRSIWGLRHLNGYATLVRLEEPYNKWSQIHTFDFGRTVFDLDISPDGRLLSASVGEISGQQGVHVFRIADLLVGNMVPLKKLELGESTPESFVFSRDGKYLYGTSYYTGVSNVFRYEIATEKLEAVSNAETGFFRPLPLDDGSLVVYEYTGQGMLPGKLDPDVKSDVGAVQFLGSALARKHPVVNTWAAGSPNRIDIDSLQISDGKYFPADEMTLSSIYPVLEGYRDEVALGFHAIVEDPLQFNRATATVSYSDDIDTGGENWHVDLNYETLNWSFRYWHNDADFYDLFGPTERARAGNAFIVGYNNSLIYDPPRKLEFNANLAHYSDLDTLPGAQEVQTSFTELTSVDAELVYTNTSKSLGAVDHEKGWRWNLATTVDYANSEAFPSVRGGVDFGAPLPIKNASVWLYSAVGSVVDGDRRSPLGSMYLGAFGNNYVDNREIKRYREFDSFPGFDINEISARSYARSIAELNLPPIRFREVGTPALFLKSIRPALFGGVLRTKPAQGSDRTFQSLGLQIDLHIEVAHHLPMTLSLGYARGFEDGDAQGDEFLISLKVM